MSVEEHTVDVYWTVQRGRRFTISLSEEAAWASLDGYWAYSEDPEGWAVVRTTETIAAVIGEIHDGALGELIELNDDGGELSRVPYVPVKVMWSCPHCGNRHLTDLYDHPIDRSSPRPNPSIWFCELGQGIVLVRW